MRVCERYGQDYRKASMLRLMRQAFVNWHESRTHVASKQTLYSVCLSFSNSISNRMRRRAKLYSSAVDHRRSRGRSWRRLGTYIALLLVTLSVPAWLTLTAPQVRRNVLPTTGPVEKTWGGIAKGIPAKPRSLQDIHIVFSTDCSPYQNYQSVLLFHSAEVSVVEVQNAFLFFRFPICLVDR